ncbi:MAG: glutamate synthase subunit beta [Clostridiales bacterium]|jgi:glutamate synthase (NADPH/NADH) small chain|nr:glutamate synthase subunit beta [Clostridiales bacterium]
MGKITGFMEFDRENPPERDPLSRAADFNEYVLPVPDELLCRQSARCMDCGVPFCHAGFITDGNSIGCPLRNLIPEVNDLVYRGNVKAAYARLRVTNPFPEFTGRVCPALCEGSCTLGEHGDPVTVKLIEKFAADEAAKEGFYKSERAPRIGKKAAVIGAGPSGLAAAEYLNRFGADVTVFEKADRPGGLLMYGIPNMKLDKKIVMSRAAELKKEGVEFVFGAEVGVNYPLIDIVRGFDAVVVCIGAGRERRINADGADNDGVVTAMTYLTASTRAVLAKKPSEISAKGKRVIVVGGGDTGTDCVATAVRQGAAGVVQLEIMPPPPDKRPDSTPWPLFPRLFKTDYGHKEAAAVFGADPRRFLTTVKRINGKNGRVVSADVVKVRWEGRNFVEDAKPQTLPADLIITAMGFLGPQTEIINELGLKTDPRGNIAADRFETGVPGIFAAGDARRGPSLVVWAISEGINAAKACLRLFGDK